jgi:hypothetical protein
MCALITRRIITLDVSVIIVNYNTRELLRNCLDSIKLRTIGVQYEIIVVDNGSTDGSVEMIEERFREVRLIRNQRNIGFGRANNIAILESSAKYAFLLNSDTVLCNNAIKIFYDFMEQQENNNVFCCGGALSKETGEAAASYGNLPSLREALFAAFGLAKLMPYYYSRNLSLCVTCLRNAPFVVPYVAGADMFIRRSHLDIVGSFDEDFFLYFEETELSFRQNRRGRCSMIVPDAKIIHLGGKSTPNADCEKAVIIARSRLLYYRKCHGRFAALLLRCIVIVGHGVHFCVRLRRSALKRCLLYVRL